MELVIDYNDSTEKAEIVTSQNMKGLILVEDQIYEDGRHLIFADKLPLDPKEIYAAAKADSERIAIIAQKLGLI
ncbi:MAG: hypothetical protein PHQ43_08600 [Dehalococcoidales bacterium]|nr:hypothetical protein [Dehalococcoidales bacterium]